MKHQYRRKTFKQTELKISAKIHLTANTNRSIGNPDPEEELVETKNTEEQIPSEDSPSVSTTLTLDGKCISPITNEFVEHPDAIKNLSDSDFLSDSLKEEALKETIHFTERCLFDISDKATLLRIVEKYELDTKQFKNPSKKLVELRQALLEKIPVTNQAYHQHDNTIWPIVVIPSRYSRSAAKAEKVKKEISNPSNGAKSKVKMFEINNLTYYQLIWLHVHYKIPLRQKDLRNRATLEKNLESHSQTLEMVQ